MMNQHTLVAVYDTIAHADAAVRDLKADNVPGDTISQHAKAASGGASMANHQHEQGFWSKLFGGAPEHDTSAYDRSIENGGSVVTVRSSDEHHDRISAILEKHNPIDLDQQAGHGDNAEMARTTNRTNSATRGSGSDALAARGTATGGDKMQLSEENLAVGKRATQGGTTRIRKYVVNTPVEEQVSLHSEKVTLDRRPVTDGRAVGEGSFRDQAIEMTERGEEAVVSKTARVKEEIGLHREGSDRTETVKDNVRREEAEVEQVAAGRNDTTRTAADTGRTAPVQGNRKV